MSFPIWAFFGLGAALLSACMMLSQEKLRVNGYALSFWIKAACVMVTAPFVILHGVPEDPLFYFYLFLTAIIYAISDVLFFSGITKTDAGAVSRLIPSASIFSFLIWFVIDPELLKTYMNFPVVTGAIFSTLCLFAYFAFRLKKCSVTIKTLRAVWFVIVAATVGPLLTKMTTFHAEKEVAIYSYVFFQALMMMGLWFSYMCLRRPIPFSEFFEPKTVFKSLSIGLIAAVMVLTKFTAFYFVDNPAYIPAVVALDSVIILFAYRLWGKKAEGDIRSGLGIVACAALLIILKAQIQN